MTRYITVLLLLTLLLAGCSNGGLFNAPPKLEVDDVVFDWEYLPTLRGRVTNTGGPADYIELAVKLTHPDDPNHIYMTGWTNFSKFRSGESRPVSILLTGERPNGEFRYYWRVSTKAGGAMY